MAKVKLYSTTFCPFCVRAKSLLKKENVDFEEINLTGKHEELNALKEKTGFMTVPQIFVGETLIGGFQELSGLVRSGEFSKMLEKV